MTHPGWLRNTLLVVAGFLTGVMSGAFGVGGAVVSTPAIRLLGVSPLFAIGTTLPSILPSAIAGTLRYAKEGVIEPRLIAVAAPAGVVATFAGSFLSHHVPGNGHWLMVLTALLLGLTAARMSRVPSATRPARAPDERIGTIAAVGATAGLLSGLLGVGGGIVLVPGFTEVAGKPLKTAIATSLACVGLFAISATASHALFQRDVDWVVAGLLTVGVVPGARIGAASALRANDRRLRLAVAAFLGIIAVVYGATELVALAR